MMNLETQVNAGYSLEMLAITDSKKDSFAVITFGKCLIDRNSGRRLAIEEQVVVRIADDSVMVQRENAERPAITAVNGRYTAFDRSDAAVYAVCDQFVKPLYE